MYVFKVTRFKSVQHTKLFKTMAFERIYNLIIFKFFNDLLFTICTNIGYFA